MGANNGQMSLQSLFVSYRYVEFQSSPGSHKWIALNLTTSKSELHVQAKSCSHEKLKTARCKTMQLYHVSN